MQTTKPQSHRMQLKIYLVLIFLLTYISLTKSSANPVQDGKILEKCLLKISTRDNLDDHLNKLASYVNWTVEEVPCLTRCIAQEKGWFDIEHNKWLKQSILDELGADMYNYCRYELDRAIKDGCAYVHRGFRCLKQAELHASTTYITLLQCAKQLNASNEELLQYTKLKAKEVIPCLFECFANKMEFYTMDGNWHLDKWLKAFGPSKYDHTDFKVCRLIEERRKNLEKCAWMYEEYLCWERINQQPSKSKELGTGATPSSKIATTMSTALTSIVD